MHSSSKPCLRILLAVCVAPCPSVLVGEGLAAEVTVDLGRAAWHPIEKARLAVFQEADALPGEAIAFSLGAYPDLRIDSFRLLLTQGHRTRTFNDAPQFRRRDGQMVVEPDADLLSLCRTLEDRQTLPVVTLFGVPAVFRDPGTHPLSLPGDLSGYLNALPEYTAAFDQFRPFMWEIWNEPNLEVFLRSSSPNEDYLRLYRQVVPTLRRANADALVAGPSTAGHSTLFDDFVETLQAEPHLAPDAFSIHHYGRRHRRARNLEERERAKRVSGGDFGKRIYDPEFDGLAEDLTHFRAALNDDFNHIPFIVTEYEHFRAGGRADVLRDHRRREQPEGAATFLDDALFFLEQPDVAFVNWNRFRRNGRRSRHGGLLGHEGEPLPHLHARSAVMSMPEERVPLSISPEGQSDLMGMASMDETRVSILIWSSRPSKESSVSLQLEGCPSDLTGMVKVSRLDALSWLDGKEPIESTLPVASAPSVAMNLRLNPPGYVAVTLPRNAATPATDSALRDAVFLGDLRWCDRSPHDGTPSGNYGWFDRRTGQAFLGARRPGSFACAGFRAAELPTNLSVEWHTPLEGSPRRAVCLLYEVGGKVFPRVLCESTEPIEQIQRLPWLEPAASRVRHIERDWTNTNDTIDLDLHAPAGWSLSERRAGLLIWMEADRPDTQMNLRLL